jgi:hypothetical protein
MARKATDLLADLDELGSEEQPSNKNTAAKSGPSIPTVTTSQGENPFDDIEKELAAKPAPSSRPTTPRLSSSTTSGTNKSPKRGAEHTPASSGPPSGRNSEDRLRNAPRASGEGRSYHQASTPGEQEGKAAEEKSSGGGWWGSMFSAASAAVKQAETLAKEIQKNEEAIRWAESVKGYGAGLSSLSMYYPSFHLTTQLLGWIVLASQTCNLVSRRSIRRAIHRTLHTSNRPRTDML